jgi:hypothetical protein
MPTILRFSLACVAVGAVAAVASAQPCYTCSADQQSFKESFAQNVMWPTQYVMQPRNSICTTFELMANNGWRRQNLLGRYHFQPDSTELSDAGRLKVQWILTQTPPHRRQVFVERAVTQDETTQRVASVQQWAEDLSFIDGVAAVNETHIIDYGRPAGAVDAIFTGFSANQPPPVLPQGGGTGSSSSSGTSN